MADGNPAMLKGFTSNEVFLAPWVYNTTTIFRNRELSNDLAIMRTDPEWSEYPLSPTTFADWLTHQQGSVTTLSMDYETLGERQSDATGVFEFWRTMILACKDAGNRFMTRLKWCVKSSRLRLRMHSGNDLLHLRSHVPLERQRHAGRSHPQNLPPGKTGQGRQ
ncbi:MAG: hypothetical protein ACLT8E_03925 [Akkermansia sp.]